VDEVGTALAEVYEDTRLGLIKVWGGNDVAAEGLGFVEDGLAQRR